MPDDRGCWELRFLDLHVRVRGASDVLERLTAIRPVPPGWTRLPRARAVLELEVCGDDVLREGALVARADRRSEVLGVLDRAIMATTLEHLGQARIVLHAGAVARGQAGVLLPAPSGSGKSTLVAGLVHAGYSYLSDEVALVDSDSGHLTPFPNWIGVKPGARRALAGLYPELIDALGLRIDGRTVCPLLPADRAWPNGSVRTSAIILPRFRPRVAARITPLPRSAALAACLAQSFKMSQHGWPGVRTVIELVQGAACYALSSADVAESVKLVSQVLPV